MSRTLARILVLVALVGGVVALVAGKLVSEAEGTGAQKKKSSANLVTTYEVQPTSITDTFSAVGTLRPVESIAIKNEVPGKVVRIGFEEGERVDEGEVLLQMRSSTLRAELKVKQRRRELLETEVDRQKRVLEQGGISQQQFDATQNELEVLDAEIDRVRAELQKTSVRAPFDGRVGIREVSPGAILTTGTHVARLVRTDPMELEFSVPERFVGQIEKGSEVRFRTHGTDEIRSATIRAMDANLDTETRALRVEARVSNPDGDLRPGMFAEVRTKLRTIEDALAVPAPALVQSAQETFVWLNVGGEAKKRPVQIGLRTEGKVEITEGLSAGDVVVTTGRQTLQPGAKLKVDTSEDAMNVEAIGPDPSRPGMRNRWFSEETIDDGADEDDSASGDDSESESTGGGTSK